MPSLYNCRHSGDQYRISKFDPHFDLEASYLTDLDNCDCPAGHRPTCRHRQMLPKFISRDYVGKDWFFDFDRGGWVHGGNVITELASEASAVEGPDNQVSDEEIAFHEGYEELVPQASALGERSEAVANAEGGALEVPAGITILGMDDLLGVHNAIANAVGEPQIEPAPPAQPAAIPQLIRRRV